MDAHPGTAPFIMNANSLGWLYVPSGLKDGPLPTHYEPLESPIENLLYAQQNNPPTRLWERPENLYHLIGDRRCPYILTTYRLTELHCAGHVGRAVPWLAEFQPEAVAEVSPQLAEELGIENAGWATLSTARGESETRVLVTPRAPVLQLDGRTVHVLSMPWHYGLCGTQCGTTLGPP